MAFTEVTALWSGFSGAPGYTKLKFDGTLTSSEATAAAGRVRTFFQAINQYLPIEVTITFSAAAQQFDGQGQLIGEVPVTPAPTTVTGTATGSYAGGAGFCVQWITGAFNRGRKVQGKTYLVPAGAAAFEANGTLSIGAVQAITNAANALAGSAPQLVVFSRPQPDQAGLQALVSGAAVPDRSAILRSRRD